jgi:alpha-amylase
MNSLNSLKPSRYLNLYFQVHQPLRLKKFQFFDIGSGISYFDNELNERIMKRIAANCYLPVNGMLMKLVKKKPDIRITFSISGVALEQMERYAPAVIESFRLLASTGSVEFLGETYYHSLSSLIDFPEFELQVRKHSEKIFDLFGVLPRTFRNTELIYSDKIGEKVYELGFDGIYLEGIESLVSQGVNQIYEHPTCDLILLPRNYRLSDDISFRYSDHNWNQWPMTPEKYVTWLKCLPSADNFVCLGMDYETFGEHQKAGSGILKFLERIITMLSKGHDYKFLSAVESISKLQPKGKARIQRTTSWADRNKDLSAWVGNDLQKDAFYTLYKLGKRVVSMTDQELFSDYRNLQSSDHFYYMSTKTAEDGNVHQYFSPYHSPYEAFVNYMNVLADLELRVDKKQKAIPDQNFMRKVALEKRVSEMVNS